jgi:hypothetical protein
MMSSKDWEARLQKLQNEYKELSKTHSSRNKEMKELMSDIIEAEECIQLAIYREGSDARREEEDNLKLIQSKLNLKQLPIVKTFDFQYYGPMKYIFLGSTRIYHGENLDYDLKFIDTERELRESLGFILRSSREKRNHGLSVDSEEHLKFQHFIDCYTFDIWWATGILNPTNKDSKYATYFDKKSLPKSPAGFSYRSIKKYLDFVRQYENVHWLEDLEPSKVE